MFGGRIIDSLNEVLDGKITARSYSMAKPTDSLAEAVANFSRLADSLERGDRIIWRYEGLNQIQSSKAVARDIRTILAALAADAGE